MSPELKLTADEANATLRKAFSRVPPDELPVVTSAAPGAITVMRKCFPPMVRPGDVIAGPVLMSLADTASFLLVLCHLGSVEGFSTSSLVIHFLTGAKAGDVYADARLLRLGRRSAVCEVEVWTEGPDKPAAHAVVTYALPVRDQAS